MASLGVNDLFHNDKHDIYVTMLSILYPASLLSYTLSSLFSFIKIISKLPKFCSLFPPSSMFNYCSLAQVHLGLQLTIITSFPQSLMAALLEKWEGMCTESV
jgi:hypothetical protein